jgi:ribosomal protein L4
VQVWKSLRNFPHVQVRPAVDVCAHDVIAARLVLAEEGALDALAERVGVGAACAGAEADQKGGAQ